MTVSAVLRVFPQLCQNIDISASFMRRSVLQMGATVAAIMVLSSGANAEEPPTAQDLLNTFWVTQDGYSYVAVTPEGTVDAFSGASFYVEFVESKHGVLVARVQWISPEEKLSEIQHLLFVPEGAGAYAFQSAGAPNVIGGTDNGFMRFDGDGTAAFTSFNLESDRVGAIKTTLTQVDELPDRFKSD